MVGRRDEKKGSFANAQDDGFRSGLRGLRNGINILSSDASAIAMAIYDHSGTAEADSGYDIEKHL